MKPLKVPHDECSKVLGGLEKVLKELLIQRTILGALAGFTVGLICALIIMNL